MAQRGLQLRKRSDSINEANIQRFSFNNDSKTNELTKEVEKLALRTRDRQGKRKRSNTLGTTDIERLSMQKNEQAGSIGFIDRFLTTLGLRRQTTDVVKGQADREKHKISLESEAADTNSCEADDGGTIDYHGIGLFCPLDLESEHRDFLVDIVNYGFSKQAIFPVTMVTDWRPLGGYRAFTLTNLFLVEIFYSDRLPTEVLPLAAYLVAVTASKRTLRRDQLENLCIAAMRLATKIESQYLLSEEILADFDLKKLNRMEREICEATEFRLLQCGAIFFMRIIQKLVERHSWQWKFAKFASQLAYCQMELAMLKPALLAGVVMRLCCLLVGDNEWPQECYEVLGEPIEDYDEPHAILCRLILTARVDDVFAEVYVHWHYVVERGLSIRPGWIEEQSKAANHIKMVGDRIFKE